MRTYSLDVSYYLNEHLPNYVLENISSLLALKTTYVLHKVKLSFLTNIKFTVFFIAAVDRRAAVVRFT